MHHTAKVLARRSAICCNLKGRYSSMMDMGGVPQSQADTRINVGKNNKVMAVALDFHLITRSIEARRLLADEENAARNNSRDIKNASTQSNTIKPDVSLVQSMANLLNVNLGGDSPTVLKQPEKEDDLSAILGSVEDTKEENKKSSTRQRAPPHMDIRDKYASKLKKKIDGGVAGLELANSEKEGTMSKGDASLHMSARNLISQEGMMQTTNTSSSKWLATTGVGKLLSFLSGRSMQIALLPLPSTISRPQSDEHVKQTEEEMQSLTRQLPNIKFDVLIPDGRRRGEEQTERSNDNTAQDIIQNVLSKVEEVPPVKIVVVSDRDDYLKAARDSGMFTCRIQPLNKRRGNITTNYNVDDVASVQDVINEINGISFNATLNR